MRFFDVLTAAQKKCEAEADAFRKCKSHAQCEALERSMLQCTTHHINTGMVG